MTGPVDRLRGLYGPSSLELARQLPDLADGLHAQLSAFAVTPSLHAAERLAANLEGAKAHVLRTADAFAREVTE